MVNVQDLYNKLSYYTLNHSDSAFIHQNIVDAYAAQVANEKTKPIAIVFALVGLYLTVEKNFTGKQVQGAHMQLAKQQKQWPIIVLPERRGAITVSEVIVKKPGQERDQMIGEWCASVWNAYKTEQQKIRNLVKKQLDI